MEERKETERQYHDLMRDEKGRSSEYLDYVNLSRKWYSIARKDKLFSEMYFHQNCKEGLVLDYCCGSGGTAIEISKAGAARVIGIDIAEKSLGLAREATLKEGADSTRLSFVVMDAERMGFRDSYFDVVHENGSLHHLDLEAAYRELSRVLKPAGKCICTETCGHNPLIHAYRKRTPQLRTDWEVRHILKKRDIERASQFFGRVEILGFFYLTSIAAVPFRSRPRVFKVLLRMLEAIDGVLLTLPVVKWQAWQVVFELSMPKIGR